MSKSSQYRPKREKEADSIIGLGEYWRSIEKLATQILPDLAVSRDLMLLLSYYHVFDLMSHTRIDLDRAMTAISVDAWLGYTKPDRLYDLIGDRFPDSQATTRTIRFIRELEQKNSTYMFLPVKSGIEKTIAYRRPGSREAEQRTHQNLAGFVEHGDLRRLVPRLASATAACDLINLVAANPSSQAQSEEDRLRETVLILRNNYELGQAVLRESISYLQPDDDNIVDEINRTCPWLWLDALVLIHNKLAGQQTIEFACRPEAVR